MNQIHLNCNKNLKWSSSFAVLTRFWK